MSLSVIRPLKLFCSMACLLQIAACSDNQGHPAPAIHDTDSVSTMVSYGVNTLISDSGAIKYRIVAETWDVNQTRQPSRWTFVNGIFLEQYDNKFNIQAVIQADTAWYYDKLRMWELRGRVRVRNRNGLIFRSSELFWDGMTHELYSNMFSRLITPERTLEGTYFRSDEQMLHYTVSNSRGSFVRSDVESKPAQAAPVDSTTAADTTQMQPQLRPAAKPKARQAVPQTAAIGN